MLAKYKIGDKLIELHDSIEHITRSMLIDFKKCDWQFVESARKGHAKESHIVDAVAHMLYPKTPADQIPEEYYQETFDGFVYPIYAHYFGLFSNWTKDVTELIKPRLKARTEATENLHKAVELLESGDLALEEEMNLILMLSFNTGLASDIKGGYTFDYRDKTFTVSKSDVTKYYTTQSFTAGQAVMMTNIREETRKRIAKKTDIDGVYEMELSVYEMAILCMEEGDRIPIKPNAQKLYLGKKGQFFEDISMFHYYNILFFLITMLLKSGRTQIIEGFFKTYGKGNEAKVKTPPRLQKV